MDAFKKLYKELRKKYGSSEKIKRVSVRAPFLFIISQKTAKKVYPVRSPNQCFQISGM
ncbi:hypothetical protein KJ695_01450 [Patescibacteria group bacterium]|nr:hypothetical protein [Patescibacteria group bacterium]